MRSKSSFWNIEYAEIGKWLVYIAAVGSATGAIIGWVSKFFEWGNKWLFPYLKNNAQTLWLSFISLVVFLLLFWTSLLRRRFKHGFHEKFEGSLTNNWDFNGGWRVTEKGTLLVTGPSEGGGITKVGAQWENYTISFKAKIIRHCLGVIVRAQDLDNYFMFQIREDKIRPHRRATVPMVLPSSNQQWDEKPLQMQPITFTTGWQVFNPPIPLSPKLQSWFDCMIRVRGESVWIHINNELVVQRESFLKIKFGKVGFRNAGDEEALVKNVRVVLEP